MDGHGTEANCHLESSAEPKLAKVNHFIFKGHLTEGTKAAMHLRIGFIGLLALHYGPVLSEEWFS